MNTQSDDILLLRWHGHRDAHAFRELARRHAPMVFATCRRILRNASEAEDLTQECFLFLAQQTASPPECVPAWLHIVAVRRSLSRLHALGRRASRERRYAEEQSRTLEPGPSEILNVVDEALAELPELLRAPLVLHFLEQRSQDEIAAQLGVAQSTISRRLDKGIAELRSRLEQKRVFVSAVALAAGLQAEAGVMVPPSLGAALGKISLAGGSAGVAATMGMSAAQIAGLGGVFLMKKILVAAIGITALSLAIYWSIPDESAQRPTGSTATSQGTSSESTSSVAQTAASEPNSEPVSAESSILAKSDTTSVEASGGVIQGHVRDAITGEGLSGVVVTAKWGNPNGSAGAFGEKSANPTDESGAYRIAGLSAASEIRYELSRDTPKGYRRPTYLELRNVLIGDSGVVSDVDFLLRKEALLSGTVVDQHHRPVSGASVSMAGGMDLYVSEKASTDASGSFSFHSLPPTEDLSIVATKDTELVSEPYTFALPEAGVTDLVLVLSGACKVSGTVVDTTGKPLAGYLVGSVRVPHSRTGTGMTERTGSDGRFEIVGLAAGSYELVATKSEILNAGSEQKGLLVELGEGEYITDVTLVLYGRDLAISGRVTNSAGDPVENVTVNAGSVHHGGGAADSDSAGRFSIQNLEEGDYQIDVSPREQYQHMELTGIPAGTSDLEIVLPEPFQVTGRVLDAQTGQPIPEFEIVLSVNWGDSLNSWVEKQFQRVSNPEGRFALHQSQLYGSMLAARAPGYATAMQSLDLTGPPYIHDVDLKLERGQALTGQVLDSRGAPIEGAAIYWGAITAMGDRAAAQSAADGTFSLPAFPSAPQRISAYHPSYAPASMMVQGTARLQPLSIVLSEGGVVEGTVAFAEGIEPVACTVAIAHPEQHHIPAMSVEVDPEGAFRIEHVQPGAVTVYLRTGANLPFEQRFRLSQETFVQPGNTAIVDFEVQWATGVLDGVLQYPQGALPSRTQLRVECETDAGTISRATIVAHDGAFRFESLPVGPAELKIDAMFQNHRRIETSVGVEVAEGDGPLVEIPL